MSTLAERFAAAVDVALKLDTPSQVLRRILADPVDNGLRAASYDGKIRGGSPESHPERMAEAPARPAGGAHISAAVDLSATSTRVLEAALGLLDLFEGRSPAVEDYRWDDALHDMHMLATRVDADAARALRRKRNDDDPEPDEPDPQPLEIEIKLATEVATCDMTGEIPEALPIHATMGEFCQAMLEYHEVVRFVEAHPPSQYQQDRTTQWCRNHARLGVQEKRHTRALCRWCWRQVQDLEPLGDPVLLQLDPLLWPSDEMLRAHIDQRVKDTSAHRRDWLVSLGLDPIQVHNRRQKRRSA